LHLSFAGVDRGHDPSRGVDLAAQVIGVQPPL
jgi:hypothetical protein